MTGLPNNLSPRKSPVQQRSQITFDAIHIATIQVLAYEGLDKCTTTRVAERAGVSVGALYQYYPHRSALLAAALSRNLSTLVNIIERCCEQLEGVPLAEMIRELVDTFLAAKFRNKVETRALYAISVDHGGPVLIEEAGRRMDAAIARMLKTEPESIVRDPAIASTIIRITLSGITRAVLTGDAPSELEQHVNQQCMRLIFNYLSDSRIVPNL
ncbi:TetR/AcrR family transcriptional regulator [Gynuella sunshinyii]|uniref:Transcriptional regulator n=1 Tax=Gynuella sunshinyii YC6258 TaxID=1445510 RepID=A0A0C5VE92_9GAMM|nr:TetR/AcrR family transcriptional regulator [Gynuella sunshinyii]AJQ92842.1 transcriptional regulator [Gynuella sunshinyii YC6258]